MIKDKEARFQMVRARSGLVAEAPFFGTLSLKLILKEDYGCKTMWTDGIHLGYNPGFVHELTIGKIRGVVCHECMHCACKHHTRRGDRDHDKWNKACDWAINPLVIDAGFRLPEGALIDPQYYGMSAEEIYSKLPDEPGSGGGGFGEVRDLPNPEDENQPASESQKKEHEVEWELTIRQAKNQATAEGKMPGGVKELVENILKPKVDWRVVLRRFIETITRNDYQWIPPNRRFVHMGIYLPSVFSRELQNGVLAIDTSGSTLGDRKQFAGELNGILEEYNTELQVLYIDTKVCGTAVFKQEDLPITILQMSGGGGTRFAPAFEWVERNYDGDPGYMIYLTDLECSDYPASPPDYPVLWVKTPNGWGSDPPWGEMVHMGN